LNGRGKIDLITVRAERLFNLGPKDIHMKWFLMLLVFIAGIYYLVNQRGMEARRKAAADKTKQEQIKAIEEMPLPVRPEKEHVIQFSMQTLQTLRTLASDSNEKVRFAAIELLWELQDEQAPSVIKRMLQEETDTGVKKRLIAMIAKDKSKLSLALLSEAMNDYDKNTRLLAVEAIGGFSNKEAILVLNKGMKDYDEEVRLKSIEAVNRVRGDIEANKEQQIKELVKRPLFTVN
jgi:HEAT repeat protein